MYADNYVSFQEVDKTLAAREAVYVRNVSAQIKDKPIQILVLTYPSAEGQQSFYIPRTSIPFNICDYVDPEGLRQSRTFRQYLNAGALEIVPTEKAEREVRDPARRAAFQRSYNEANRTATFRSQEEKKAKARNQQDASASASAMSRDAINGILGALDPRIAKELATETNATADTGPVFRPTKNPRLVTLESKVKSGSIEVHHALEELELLLGELSVSEMEAISADSIWPQPVRTWAGERLQHMYTTENEDAEQASA